MNEQKTSSFNRKYSKVSSAIKCQLFKLIYLEKISIKKSAKLCNLNYSTAKSLLKNMTKKQQKFISNLLYSRKFFRKTKKAQWRNFPNSSISYKITPHSTPASIFAQGFNHKQTENQSIKQEIHNLKPISIVSSIGFDFFKIENEQKMTEKFINFSSPFLNRRGFSCVLNLKKITQKIDLFDKENHFRCLCLRRSLEICSQQNQTQKIIEK